MLTKTVEGRIERKKIFAIAFSCVTLFVSVGSAQTVTGSGTANTVPKFTGTGTSSTVGNSPISISGSNVGIGTASPAAPLHVVGTIRKDFTASVTGGTGYWMLYANDGSANFNEYINSTGTTSPTAVVQGAGFRRLFSPEPTGTTDTFNYQYANTVAAGSPQSWLDYMTVDATHNYLNLMDHGGNVGIGTTAPSYLLDVAGEIRSSSGGIVFPDGSTQTTAFNPATGLNLPNGFTVNSTSAGQITEYIRGSSTGDANIVLQAGNGSGPAFWFTATGTTLEIGNTGSNEPTSGTINVAAAGNVGIGTSSPGAKLEVNGGLRFSSDPSGTVQTTAWTGVLCGGDYAEAVDPAGDKNAYEAGDVLVITDDTEGDVRKSAEPYSTMVAGIFATKPGVVGRRESLPKDAQDLPMAMIGIVPTKVTAQNGPIHRGDLLVTSSIPGYAMKGTDRGRLVGAVIGKAMGKLDSGKGVIEVLVTLQ